MNRVQTDMTRALKAIEQPARTAAEVRGFAEQFAISAGEASWYLNKAGGDYAKAFELLRLDVLAAEYEIN